MEQTVVFNGILRARKRGPVVLGWYVTVPPESGRELGDGKAVRVTLEA